ncbi:MAG TPA: DUF3500 domain-containing protein, partial [Candidatus Limnocylindria bacterium]|nr:DUF3500 domain-containing protein [Candidatus Limnocylindria bacterium]
MTVVGPGQPGISLRPHFAIAQLPQVPLTLRMLKTLTLFLVASLPLLGSTPVEDMTDAASRFSAALTPEQKAKATFTFGDDERTAWHFIPKDRKGIPLKELTSAQKHLAYGLLTTGLSQRGLLKATTIMSLEQVLQDLEGPKRTFPRDPELYYVSLFGTPDVKGTWGWRIEGHHLSVNMTIADGQFAAGTPLFMGSNPAEVRIGQRAGLRVLGGEEDTGRALVQSLEGAQKTAGIISDKAPDDILTLNKQKAELNDPSGLPVAQMNAKQVALVDQIIAEYVGRL